MLIRWARELSAEISNQRALELEALQEEFLLLKEGRIKTLGNIIRKILEEHAAVMAYEGAVDRDEAERRNWCNQACVLRFPSQWRMCERFKLMPCMKLQKQSCPNSGSK